MNNGKNTTLATLTIGALIVIIVRGAIAGPCELLSIVILVLGAMLVRGPTTLARFFGMVILCIGVIVIVGDERMRIVSRGKFRSANYGSSLTALGPGFVKVGRGSRPSYFPG
jgi:hypothetical protein